MTVRHLLSGAVAATALTLLFAGGAQAQSLLAPGTLGQAVPTVGGNFGGAQIGSTQTASFTATNAGQTITGRLLSAVFSGGTAQTIGGSNFGGSGLDLYYQLFLDGGNTTVDSLSLSNFAGFSLATAQTAADVDGAGGMVAGTSVASTNDRSGNGVGILFNFSTTLPTGGTSLTFGVRTNATQFTTGGGASVQSLSGVSANTTGPLLTVVPNVAPEPGSLVLAATGLMGAMGMVGIRRRRSAK